MKEYTNGEITVFWKPDLCIHSRKCFTGLIEVFNPSKRPWVKMDGAATDEIIKAVMNCPSTALSYKRNDEVNTEQKETKETRFAEESIRMQMLNNGPMMVEGECVIMDKDGKEIYKSGKFFLCRCGHSANKPFCDSSHERVNFQG